MSDYTPQAGYRKLSPDETVQSKHFFWHSGLNSILPIRRSYVGKTLNQLIKFGIATSKRVLLEKSPYPIFEGWIGIGVDAELQVGDVIVNIKPTPSQKKKGTPDSPEKAKKIHDYFAGATLRDLYPLDRNIKAGRICVYRRVYDVKPERIRRFPPGQYARPLPLP